MNHDPERVPEVKSALQSALRLKIIPGLDATRAVAVSLVVFFHFNYLPTATGEMGVMIFFVLSGFLITRILLMEFRKSGTISLREFYRRRTLRIFPTFYVCWLVETLLIAIHREHIRWWEPWTSFFYLSDYARAIAGPETIRHMPIAWSLAIEEQFYLLWPAVLLRMLMSRKNAARAVAVFILCVWIYRAILFIGFHVSYGYIYNAFDTRIDALMIGSLLAILTVDAATDPRTAKALALPVKSPWLGVLPLGALLLTIVFYSRIKESPWLSMASFSLQPAFVAVFLIQAVCFGNSQWRLLAHPGLRFIAKISYALYLYHFLVITEFDRISFASYSGEFLGFRVLDPANHLRMLFRLAPAVIVPVISYYAVELPFMRMRDRKKRSSKAVGVDDAVVPAP